MSKLCYIFCLSAMFILSSKNLALANQCSTFLTNKSTNDFTASFYIDEDGSLVTTIIYDLSVNNLRIVDRKFIESMNTALKKDLNLLKHMSKDEIELILQGLIRYQSNVAKISEIPYYFNLLLAVTQFHLPEGNSLNHVDQAIKQLSSMPAEFQYLDYRVMHFLARSLLLTENPKLTDKYERVIRITNILLSRRSKKSIESAIEISNRLISTNIPRNIDAGLILRQRAEEKLSSF